MQRTQTLRRGLLVAAALIVGVIAAFYATHASGAASARQARVVMTAKNTTLHKTILVTRSGRTLYSLSAERGGKFICTDSTCLSLWKPLAVAKGTKPTGVAGLSTVRRPDGKTQVAYKGGPLYTFSGDRKRGDLKGNGFKDVGTWRVAVVGKTTPASSGSTPYPSHY